MYGIISRGMFIFLCSVICVSGPTWVDHKSSFLMDYSIFIIQFFFNLTSSHIFLNVFFFSQDPFQGDRQPRRRGRHRQGKRRELRTRQCRPRPQDFVFVVGRVEAVARTERRPALAVGRGLAVGGSQNSGCGWKEEALQFGYCSSRKRDLIFAIKILLY